MRSDYTDLTILLDRSGSMSSIRNDMEGGLNEFLENQKKLPGTLRVTLYQFDHVCERVYAGVDIRDSPKACLSPRGSTALYDALGRAIDETGDRLRKMAEEDRPSKVLFMVITDGYENASRERTSEQVKKLVKQQERDWNWSFVYLGADVDAFAAGADIGVKSSNSAGYEKTSGGIQRMMHVNCSKFAAYRSATTPEVATSALHYTDSERQEMMNGLDKGKTPRTQENTAG